VGFLPVDPSSFGCVCVPTLTDYLYTVVLECRLTSRGLTGWSRSPERRRELPQLGDLVLSRCPCRPRRPRRPCRRFVYIWSWSDLGTPTALHVLRCHREQRGTLSSCIMILMKTGYIVCFRPLWQLRILALALPFRFLQFLISPSVCIVSPRGACCT
jgi:hypothetical protein